MPNPYREYGPYPAYMIDPAMHKGTGDPTYDIGPGWISDETGRDANMGQPVVTNAVGGGKGRGEGSLLSTLATGAGRGARAVGGAVASGAQALNTWAKETVGGMEFIDPRWLPVIEHEEASKERAAQAALQRQAETDRLILGKQLDWGAKQAQHELNRQAAIAFLEQNKAHLKGVYPELYTGPGGAVNPEAIPRGELAKETTASARMVLGKLLDEKLKREERVRLLIRAGFGTEGDAEDRFHAAKENAAQLYDDLGDATSASQIRALQDPASLNAVYVDAIKTRQRKQAEMANFYARQTVLQERRNETQQAQFGHDRAMARIREDYLRGRPVNPEQVTTLNTQLQGKLMSRLNVLDELITKINTDPFMMAPSRRKEMQPLLAQYEKEREEVRGLLAKAAADLSRLPPLTTTPAAPAETKRRYVVDPKGNRFTLAPGQEIPKEYKDAGWREVSE